MKIGIHLEVSQSTDWTTVSLEDLNLTQEEWDTMSQDQKRAAIEIWLEDYPNQPFWMLDTFDE